MDRRLRLGGKNGALHAYDSEVVPLPRQACRESQFCRLQAREGSYYQESKPPLPASALDFHAVLSKRQ